MSTNCFECAELICDQETDVFVSLSEQYNAKIEVSKALSVIRLTSDFNTCFDLLKLIHLAIQSIRVEDVEIGSLGASTESSEENHKAFFDTMPIKELERMTNTMITPVLLGSNRYPTMVCLHAAWCMLAKYRSVSSTLSRPGNNGLGRRPETINTVEGAETLQAFQGALS